MWIAPVYTQSELAECEDYDYADYTTQGWWLIVGAFLKGYMIRLLLNLPWYIFIGVGLTRAIRQQVKVEMEKHKGG